MILRHTEAMTNYSSIPDVFLDSGELRRATVVGASTDGRLRVRDSGPDDDIHECDLLITTRDHSVPSAGAEVLVWLPAGERANGVVLGVVGRKTLKREESQEDTRPDTLILEAKQSLTLRVGEDSITIREDRKILIKGKDLVSHAKNVNRIKGGAVAIN